MQHKTTESIQVKKLESITCDKCKKTYSVDDYMEIQEFHIIDFVAGYGSVFGDGNKVQCDICQHCFKEMLNGIAAIEE